MEMKKSSEIFKGRFEKAQKSVYLKSDNDQIQGTERKKIEEK